MYDLWAYAPPMLSGFATGHDDNDGGDDDGDDEDMNEHDPDATKTRTPFGFCFPSCAD